MATAAQDNFVPLSDPAESMIEADGLSKFYGDFAATRDVSFQVRRGEVAAFLGPNGAGKSTTMKLLTGYLAPSTGVSRVAGFNMATDRIEGSKRLGYLPENGPLYPDMTPRSLLKFFGEARRITGQKLRDRIDAVVSQCRLESVIGKPIGKLSKGYRQRVGMAQVLLHEPDVLILDEPTAGLDPNQIREVRKLIRELGATKTVLLSTHILQEVEAMCNRVIFINEGRVAFDGTPAQLAEGVDSLDERFHELTGASKG
ncbi:putative ABC transporter ATP-binding protein YxlF [Pseudobythopirellula maris]|uniref:Putative ABC transporter ATP-binding protein YxlF n=1 Tax=Pseudobythopirellula maris TaxID=2527991 RepID=A0A5C5ZH96_9BACT|nr:ATP-binding cassette domain-containing protein [Pseudobythopirellula maris]TWT86251.1 putative ABC transporter ATP-binding protein YxlF [Pseudobythopirellula maris]